MSLRLAAPRSRMRKEWRNTLVTVVKMISSAKKGFLTLADFRAKRKIWSENRHVGCKTLDRHEHSKCRKSSYRRAEAFPN